MQVANIVASLTDSHFSSLPDSCGSLYLINLNTIDDEGVETNEAGIYLLSVCLVCTEYGFIFINIMCIHIHAQNHLGVKARHSDLFHKRQGRNIFKMKDWEFKTIKTSYYSNILENQG